MLDDGDGDDVVADLLRHGIAKDSLAHQLAQQIVLKVLLTRPTCLAHGEDLVGEVVRHVEQRLFRQRGERNHVLLRNEGEHLGPDFRFARRGNALDRRVHGLFEQPRGGDQIKPLEICLLAGDALADLFGEAIEDGVRGADVVGGGLEILQRLFWRRRSLGTLLLAVAPLRDFRVQR